MNRYGQMAQRHWERWLPDRYAQIRDRPAFFAALGQEISDLIEATEAQFERQSGIGPFLREAGTRNMLRLQAEERVLREMLPEPEDEEEPVPAAWAVPSASDTVAQIMNTETSRT